MTATRTARHRTAPLALLLLAPLLLVACDEAPKAPGAPGQAGGPAPAADARAPDALRATEERLRARLRIEGAMTLRAVQVHRQAMAETLAVCGQINPSGRGDEPFIPYVAVIGFEGARIARTEFHLAASSAEAARVYLEMVDRCWDGGGPPNARAALRPLPPLPSELPRNLPAAQAAPQATPQPAPQPALQSTPQPTPQPTPPVAALPPPAPPPMAPAPDGVATAMVMTTSRHPVNIRANPSGGGAVVRIAPRGSILQVFGEAPGGWLQVGEGEPWGWLHSSLLEAR